MPTLKVSRDWVLEKFDPPINSDTRGNLRRLPNICYYKESMSVISGVNRWWIRVSNHGSVSSHAPSSSGPIVQQLTGEHIMYGRHISINISQVSSSGRKRVHTCSYSVTNPSSAPPKSIGNLDKSHRSWRLEKGWISLQERSIWRSRNTVALNLMREFGVCGEVVLLLFLQILWMQDGLQ